MKPFERISQLSVKSVRRRDAVQFVDLSTVAEIGATLAGFATLASAIRGTSYDADAIFDVVANSLVALIFAVLGLALGTSHDALRVLGLLLATSSGILLVRDIQVTMHIRSDDSAVFDYDRASVLLGWSCMLIIAAPPVLGAVVAANLYPDESLALYGFALVAQIVAAALMLLDVVRRHLAHRGDPPAV
jgi:hypothetical protein